MLLRSLKVYHLVIPIFQVRKVRLRDGKGLAPWKGTAMVFVDLLDGGFQRLPMVSLELRVKQAAAQILDFVAS